MSKKDFELIARIIKEYRKGFPRQDTAGAEMADRLGDAFEQAFPRFKREVFFEACGGHVK